ncbi:MAG: class I SAM-dependent methyltransferase, partial [Methanococcaceae archaeon]
MENIHKNSKYITGKVLDIGCGRKPYKEIFLKFCTSYIGLEYIKTIHGFSEVDIVGDSLFLPFKDNQFDSIVSFQVMEHIQEPQQFLTEAFRVIKKDGYFLFATPFMWGEHEAPYDFYRYTRYGLKYLSEKAGFEVIAINPDTKYWSTAALRFNYYLMRFARGPF